MARKSKRPEVIPGFSRTNKVHSLMDQNRPLKGAERKARMSFDEAQEVSNRVEIRQMKKFISDQVRLVQSNPKIWADLVAGGARVCNGVWMIQGVRVDSEEALRCHPHLARKYRADRSLWLLDQWLNSNYTPAGKAALFELAIVRAFRIGVDFARGADATAGRKREPTVKELFFACFDEVLHRTVKNKREISHKEIIGKMKKSPLKTDGRPYSDAAIRNLITEWRRR